jgi:hypothetical protein
LVGKNFLPLHGAACRSLPLSEPICLVTIHLPHIGLNTKSFLTPHCLDISIRSYNTNDRSPRGERTREVVWRCDSIL